MSYTLKYTGSEIDDILDRAAPSGALDTAIAAKQDTLTFDDAPEAGSDNPVKSGGIFDAIKNGTVSGAFHVLGGATPNKVPYVKRATPSFAGPLEKEKAIVGASLGWNQLAHATARTHSSGVVMGVNDDGFCVLNGTASSSDNSASINTGVTSVNGHKYFVKSGSIAQPVRMRMASSGSYTDLVNGAIWNGNGQGFGAVTSIVSGTTYTNVVCPINITDLTLALGSTVADYVYIQENGTAGAGVALLREWGVIDDNYRAYDAGSIKSVNVSAHVLRDANDNIVGNYPLDAGGDLRGVLKLDANNDLYADGDEYTADGGVSVKYAIVDMGQMTWSQAYSDNNFTCTSLASVIKKATSNDEVVNALAVGYVTTSRNNVLNADKQFSVNTTGAIVAKNNAFAGYTDVQVKAALDGIYLVYELATPTSRTGDPFTELQTCAPGGTEEYTQTGSVHVPVGHDTDYYGDAVPAAPSADGTYTLQVVVSDGVPTYGWASGGGLMLSMSAPAISPSITPSIQHAEAVAAILTDEPEAEEPAEEAEESTEQAEEE